MDRPRLLPLLLLSLVCISVPASPASAAPPSQARRLSRDVLEDKIRGGWLGQMIGVAFGGPTEFKANGRIIEGDLPWQPDRIAGALNQDDLYVDMTFAQVMDSVGLDATTSQYGDAFKNTHYDLWHANAGARRLLNYGIKAPMTGQPKYNVHANDIDFQIEADFIGLMTPGLPQASNFYSERVGRVMNFGDGLYGGMFVSAMYAAAFFESKPLKVVELALASIPERSGYARLVRDVISAWRRNPNQWRVAWQEIQDAWDRDDACPDGANKPFNIDARLNGAYVVMGFLYGDGDFARTLDITTRLGQDSDCNPASSAGVLGVMLGEKGIPDVYKAGLPAIADTKFAYTDYSFNDIARSTLARAFKVIEKAGGKVTASDVMIPLQKPTAPKLEQWDMGVTKARVSALNHSWSWKGPWQSKQTWDGEDMGARRSTTGAGAEATFTFEGTAVAVVGKLGQDGGRADVFVDGKKVGMIDAYMPPRTFDQNLWHTYDLAPGPHTVRIVTRGDKHNDSKGTHFEITSAVIYERR